MTRQQGQIVSYLIEENRVLVAEVLKESGIAPAPGRPSSRRTFIRSHAAVIAAADISTTEVRTSRGLVTPDTRFVIGIATPRVSIAGTTANANSPWMAQMARNPTDGMVGFPIGRRYLLVDRDALFSERIKASLKSGGTKIVRTSLQAPKMNAYAECLVRSIKSVCLDRMIFVGGDSLDRAIRAFAIHYHA